MNVKCLIRSVVTTGRAPGGMAMRMGTAPAWAPGAWCFVSPPEGDPRFITGVGDTETHTKTGPQNTRRIHPDSAWKSAAAIRQLPFKPEKNSATATAVAYISPWPALVAAAPPPPVAGDEKNQWNGRLQGQCPPALEGLWNYSGTLPYARRSASIAILFEVGC